MMVTCSSASGKLVQKSQFREFHGVAEKEHRGIVAHEIPVAFLGVEFEGEAPDITLGVGSAALTGYGGETGKHLSLLAYMAEDGCLGIPGDVVGYGECAKSAGTLGVHAALGNDLAVKVRHLFHIPYILHQHRATGACGHAVLVVWHRSAHVRAQLPVFTACIVAAGTMRVKPILLHWVFHLSSPSYISGWFSPAGSSNRCVQIPGYYRPRRGMVKPFWRTDSRISPERGSFRRLISFPSTAMH